MSVLESPVPIKTEPEDETCDVFEYDEARIKTERALLYAGHEVKEEMVIGPTELLRPPPGVVHPYWETARQAVANAGVDNEVEYLRRLYSSRLVLRDAAHELLCARCGQWGLTAAELHQHQRAAHSTEHPRDCLQSNACTTHLGNAAQAQPTAFRNQLENTSTSTTLTHKLFICDLCLKHFATKSLLAKHLHSHTKTDSRHQCDVKFNLKDNLKQQRKVVPNPTKALTCDICSKSYSCRGSLNKHILIHSGIRAFHCDKCGKSYTYKSNLSQHILIHKGSKPFSCSKCGKSFTQKSSLSQHMLIHNGSKPFACAKCGKRFARKSGLCQHMLIHNGFKPFACVKCGKSFTQKSGLCQHMLIHIGSKPFACVKCGKSFTQKSGLCHHMLIHNGSKPFACVKCGKSFIQKSSLSQHMLIHTGSKPFACEVCGKTFTRKFYLYKHMIIHTGSKPFTCDICGKTSARKYDLSKHMRIHTN